MQYSQKSPLRVFTAFSGYDSQCLALQRLKEQFPNFDFRLVGWSEIEGGAIQAHNALFPEDTDKNFGDITKIDWAQVPDFDLFTYSFPCQDISNAGLQRGFAQGSGTRSSLLWECEKAIAAKLPRYLLMENVKALTQKKFLPFLHKWQRILENYGYQNFTQVLNAKHYGIPQNRERVFMVSIREEECVSYQFPQPFPLTLKLADVLEEHVADNFFLRDEMLARFCEKSLENEE